MLLSDYDYELPPELIAQRPLEDRSASRMLAVDRQAATFEDRQFTDLPLYLRAGDLLVLNDTRVFPARLVGRTQTGAEVEIFLVSETADGTWTALARPAKRLKPGKVIDFNGKLAAELVGKNDDGSVEVRFDRTEDFYQVLDEVGKTPLPPYIKRDNSNDVDTDRDRYQTVFARSRGAIAAPTAGLHFTDQILDDIRTRNVHTAAVTLHVGYGTFEPVRVNDLSKHRVSPETYEISDEAADILNSARAEGRRIVAVGTTTTRALESNITEGERFTAGRYTADLSITPGYTFRAIDALLTNFHLPLSSLLVLTSTFGGRELIMRAYKHAVASGYRFYSYGDCMLIS